MTNSEVLLTAEARDSEPGQYHFVAENSASILCGVVNADSLFASDVYRSLPREQAEARGFEACRLCETMADT